MKWDALARKILNSVGIVPTRGDPSLFSGSLTLEGIKHAVPVILMKATDDFGVGTTKKQAYDFLVSLFRKWKFVVHDIGSMTFYFGTRVIISQSCISLDHNHLIDQSLIMMFGPHWKDQKLTTKSPPLPSSPEYEARLFAATPFSIPEKISHETTLGWKYRSVLGIWLFVSQRTRIDILPSVTLLSQFQNAPGIVHYDGMKMIGKYLRCHPDIPVTFKRNHNNSSMFHEQYDDHRQPHECVSMVFEEGKVQKIDDFMVNSIEATRMNNECLLLNKESSNDLI